MKLAYVYIDKYNSPTHIQMHLHNCFELVYYHNTNGYTTWKPASHEAKGPLIFTEKEKGAYEQIDFSSNTLIVIPPNTLHDEKHYGASKVTAIGFSLEEGDKLPDLAILKTPFFMRDKEKLFYNSVRRIEKEYAAHSPFFQNIICLYLNRLLLELTPHTLSTQDDLLNFIKNYIDEHFTQNLKVEDLSEQIFYSPDYFRTLFKEKFGMNPKAYIIDKRIQFAKKLIHETDLSLTRISELCGFNDYAQFNKFYKKKEKVSPSQARGDK